MQPVFHDLRELQKNWNRTLPSFSPESQGRLKERCSNRPGYLRALHVACLAILIFSASASASFILSGTVSVLRGEGVFTSFSKLLGGGLMGLLSYELLHLRDITDRCRCLFREVLHHSHPTSEQKTRWDRKVQKIEEDYKNLLGIDVILETVYPTMVHH